MDDSSTTPNPPQHEVARSVDDVPIPIYVPPRWMFWRRTIVVTTGLLREQIALEVDRSHLRYRELNFASHAADVQKKLDSSRATDRAASKLLRKIQWASSPAGKGQPQKFPGLELERKVFTFALMIGIANLAAVIAR